MAETTFRQTLRLPYENHSATIMKASLLITVLLILPFLTIAGEVTGTKVKRETKKEFHQNGNVKKITKTRIRRSKQFELYNFYKRTAITVYEFSETGTLLSKEKTVTKVGDSGRPCFEIVTLKTTYYPNGKIRTKDKWICDERKGVYKEYDGDGKLQFTRINKRRRR
jgi:antitoxin component YwqK of YwqJK toxin-antitoxin module